MATPANSAASALRLLETSEQEREQKTEGFVRKAAKAGFDAIDQGRGVFVNGERGLDELLDQVAAEARRKGQGG